MTEAQSQSCIQTDVTIPKEVLLQWILSRFPEIHEDAKIDNVVDTYTGSVKFTILHTRQEPKPAGPIMLTPPNKDVEDAEVQ